MRISAIFIAAVGLLAGACGTDTPSNQDLAEAADTLPLPAFPCEVLPLPKAITWLGLRDLGLDNLAHLNADRAYFAQESDGAEPLVFDDDLFVVAMCHAMDMCQRQFFDHVDPEGVSPGERIETGLNLKFGRDFYSYGENIAFAFDSRIDNLSGNEVHREVVRLHHRGYMDECQCREGCPSQKQAGHRTNILRPDFREVGIAQWYCEADQAFYNVQNFWRRQRNLRRENPYCDDEFTADPPSPSTTLN